MSTPFIGEIIMFAGNFAPRGWAFCQGQILSIAQNTALFSILGTTYGGNGQTTFALPDLRGRVPIGQGQGPGLPAVSLGEVSGSPTHTLIQAEMPQHNHLINTVADVANTANPTGGSLAVGQGPNNSTLSLYSNQTPNSPLNAQTCGIAGGSQPFSVMQPYLGMNYIIALQGIFPSRN
jgi:microcystin-dependent protein